MLIPATAADLGNMLAWRNQEQNRLVSTNSALINAAEHQNWWAQTSADPTRRVLLFTRNQVAYGVVNFADIQVNSAGLRTATWGFYLDHEGATAAGLTLMLWPMIMRAAIDYSFDELSLDELHAEVLPHNQAVRSMNQRLGFIESAETTVLRAGKEITVIPIVLPKANRKLRQSK